MGSGWENLRVDGDGLITPDVGSSAETKYRLLALYDQLFSTGMKNKWDQRVCVDLYAGAGHSRILGTSTVFKGSPMIALTVTDPFDKYIFCEEKWRPLRCVAGPREPDRTGNEYCVRRRQLR